MASELQELFAELNKVAGEEKKKFAEKVKADSDLQSMFSQLSEIKKENDKEKEGQTKWLYKSKKQNSIY